MADFYPFLHGKYGCPYLDERIWTEFSKRIRPGAHRARITILTFSCMCREYILYVQRTYCMCREYILYVQRIHISQNNIFSKNNILYIFPKPVDPQNFRSSISPNSRVWGGGTHPVLSAIPRSYRHVSNGSLTRWDEQFVFSISVVQPRQKARNLSATNIGVWVQCFLSF